MACHAESVLESPPRMRVMVCIDDSENAQLAFEYYAEHFHNPENEVIVLHVSDDVKFPTYLYTGGAFSGGEGINASKIQASIDEVRQRNERIENDYNSKCSKRRIKNKVLIVSRVEAGGVGPAIVDAANKHNVNLIVVGSRGLGTIRRTILGSVSSYVMNHSHIPTLIYPPKN